MVLVCLQFSVLLLCAIVAAVLAISDDTIADTIVVFAVEEKPIFAVLWALLHMLRIEPIFDHLLDDNNIRDHIPVKADDDEPCRRCRSFSFLSAFLPFSQPCTPVHSVHQDW